MGQPLGGGRTKSTSAWKKFVRITKRLLRGREENYSETILWSLYERYLPKQTGLTIVEVGSAPGWNLLNFKNRLGYIPYGIEYSHVGAEQNRRKFIASGVSEGNVIESDFFSKELQERYKEHFDIVMSGGFIEHFDDPTNVIQKHVDLIKKNGYFIITVPNFQGVNSVLARFFNEDIASTHNFSILNKEGFEAVFPQDGIEKLYCHYFGTLYFGLYAFNYEKNGRLKYFIYRFLVRLQIVLNVLFSFVLGKKGFETKYTSPYIIFIGKKL